MIDMSFPNKVCFKKTKMVFFCNTHLLNLFKIFPNKHVKLINNDMMDFIIHYIFYLLD